MSLSVILTYKMPLLFCGDEDHRILLVKAGSMHKAEYMSEKTKGISVHHNEPSNNQPVC
jgi:hypothetical protein